MRYNPYHAALLTTGRSPLRRAFTLSGVFPLGAFLLFHLGANLRALRGEGALAATLDGLHRSPVFWGAEVALVYAPLLIHGGIGAWLVAKREPLDDPPLYSPPAHAVVRMTGVVAAVFLLVHLFDVRVAPGGRVDGAMMEAVLAARLSAMATGVPWLAIGYLFATACVAIHFAAGCWGAYARAARTRGHAGRLRWVAAGATAVGIALGVGFADAVVFHATGVRLLGHAAPAAAIGCP